jgi:hypothetical protein
MQRQLVLDLHINVRFGLLNAFFKDGLGIPVRVLVNTVYILP